MTPSTTELFALPTKEFVDQICNEKTIDELFDILVSSNDDYHGGEDEPFLTDEVYDVLYRKLKLEQPHHIFFTGIGSEVRGSKVDLPHPMGSLNQIYDGEIIQWLTKHKQTESRFISTEKLDGISAMAIYPGNDKPFQIGYSRGNGTKGADITRHMKHIVPATISYDSSAAIRGEIILPKANFEYLKTLILSRAGTQYRNARNMVAGLMNSKTVDPIVYDHLHFVAYQVVGVHMGKYEMLQLLENQGFRTPKLTIMYGKEMTDALLTEHLITCKQDSVYELDGIVVDIDDISERMSINPSVNSLNPVYSFKYKITDNYAATVITKIEWRLSKHGYLKPRVHVAPVELVGVTVRHANGLNARFVIENELQIGTKVGISRCGDVVPNIIDVIGIEGGMSSDEFTTDLHNTFTEFGDWEWTKTEVDALVSSLEGNKTIIVKQLLSFFDKTEISFLAIGNLSKLYDADFTTVESIILAEESDLVAVLGKIGSKAYNSIHQVLQNIPLYKLVGAYSTTRGIGVRRMKLIQEGIGPEFLTDATLTTILDLPKFQTITATAAFGSIVNFIPFFELIEHLVTIEDTTPSGTSLTGKKICFTGFRDKELQSQVEDNGGSMQSGVSSKTNIVVTTDPNGTSSKLKKARDLNVNIISVDELKLLLS